jgi:hypothetical protein
VGELPRFSHQVGSGDDAIDEAETIGIGGEI